MNPPLTLKNDERYLKLEKKLKEVDCIEQEVAPSGVSFSVVGQERVMHAHNVKVVSDSHEAAQAALNILRSRKEILAELEDAGEFSD